MVFLFFSPLFPFLNCKPLRFEKLHSAYLECRFGFDSFSQFYFVYRSVPSLEGRLQWRASLIPASSPHQRPGRRSRLEKSPRTEPNPPPPSAIIYMSKIACQLNQILLVANVSWCPVKVLKALNLTFRLVALISVSDAALRLGVLWRRVAHADYHMSTSSGQLQSESGVRNRLFFFT